MEKLDDNTILSSIAIPASAHPKDRESFKRYHHALQAHPIRKVRGLIAACRASGQRRYDLMNVIQQGNKENLWGIFGIPEWQLLRDCETRWSSSYLMIGRALTLYPVSIHFHLLVIVIKHHDGKAIQCFLAHPKNTDIVHHLLSSDEFQVLQDIHQILEVLHTAQELLSAEKTPTLSMALPVYETMLNTWKHHQTMFPELKYFIDVGMKKIEEYIARSRKSQAYALSMSKYCNHVALLYYTSYCYSLKSRNEIQVATRSLVTRRTRASWHLASQCSKYSLRLFILGVNTDIYCL